MISFIEFKENCINLVRGKLKLENASANGGSPLSGYYYRVEDTETNISISYSLDRGIYTVSLYSRDEMLGIGFADNLIVAYMDAENRAKVV